jgi:hypothetical protein
MTVSDRMLVGSIASNPGRYDGPGEYRYSLTRKEIYFSSAAKPDARDAEPYFPLPALNPDGSKRMEQAFKQFIQRRWLPSRQQQLEEFARKKGWDLAMELRYGGGALEDNEAEEWQYVVNRELERLARQVKERIERDGR